MLYRFRALSAIRGASPLFLGLVLLGLAMSCGGFLAWTYQQVSEESCLAFQWLSSLGFSLVFAPLFSKTYRMSV
jgi:ABC-type Mn2+/Zn2+ transport system permease subunit